MSLHAHTPDNPESLSNAALSTLLARVEEEERELSRRRRALHEKVDDLEGRADETPEAAADLLHTLQQEERSVSERRLEAHRLITELRMERGRRLSRLRAPLRAVEAD